MCIAGSKGRDSVPNPVPIYWIAIISALALVASAFKAGYIKLASPSAEELWSVPIRATTHVPRTALRVPVLVKTLAVIVFAKGNVENSVNLAENRACGNVSISYVVNCVEKFAIVHDAINAVENGSSAVTHALVFVENCVPKSVEFATEKKLRKYFLARRMTQRLDL